MRDLRRSVPALLLGLAFLGAAPPSAVAVTVETDLPPGWAVGSYNCETDQRGEGLFTTEPGPGTPPLGDGSLELRAGADEQVSLGHSGGPGSLSGLQDWSMYLRPEGPQQVRAVIETNAGRHFLLAIAPTLANEWVPVDARGLWYDVYDWDGRKLMSGTIDDYLRNYSDGPFSLGIVTACAVAPTVLNVDDYRLTQSGVTTEYDFEPGPRPTSTSISTSAAVITAGQTATVRAHVALNDGTPLVRVPVELYAKPADSAAFRLVGTAYTDSKGNARLATRPVKNTAYQWRFSAGEDLPSRSEPKTVRVRVRVTLGLADSTLSAGQNLVAQGRVTPVKAGHPVSLWRLTRTQPVKLATGIIRADGTYRIAKRVTTTGSWRVYTQVPAIDHNLGGASAPRQVTIRQSR